jgi:hypothetical protein
MLDTLLSDIIPPPYGDTGRSSEDRVHQLRRRKAGSDCNNLSSRVSCCGATVTSSLIQFQDLHEAVVTLIKSVESREKSLKFLGF